MPVGSLGRIKAIARGVLSGGKLSLGCLVDLSIAESTRCKRGGSLIFAANETNVTCLRSELWCSTVLSVVRSVCWQRETRLEWAVHSE